MLNPYTIVPISAGMDKFTARLLPVAVVVTGALAAFGGYFGNH